MRPSAAMNRRPRCWWSMSDVDFTISYRERLDRNGFIARGPWDILISAFNDSERVRWVFENAKAARKVWVIHGEYAYAAGERPSDQECVDTARANEADALVEWFNVLGDLTRLSI